MSRNKTIFLFYTGVAVLSCIIIAAAMVTRSTFPAKKRQGELIIESGKATETSYFPINKDLDAINQAEQQVKLSDLRGKVWIAAEFFAVCPHCAVRNGSELREIYEAFKDDPDFHITCISVDPETDKPEKLKEYAKVLGADAKNWWFLNAGEAKATHNYLEQQLKFFGVRERTDALDIEANGRYQHDLGFLLVDRDFNVIGKWPLADARSEQAKKLDPQMYERLKKGLFDRIRAELAKK